MEPGVADFAPAQLIGITIEVRSDPSGTRARLEGDIDISVAGSVQEILLQAIRAHGPRLLLDLSGVSFLDCAGLRALLLTRRRVELRGGTLQLIAVSPSVRRILRLTGLQETFALDDALHHPAP
jgi:anti-sigma B factor antagonist